jgi:hypothetical protein
MGILHERSRKTIGFGGKRLPGNLKYNGQEGREGKANTEPGREVILQLSGIELAKILRS